MWRKQDSTWDIHSIPVVAISGMGYASFTERTSLKKKKKEYTTKNITGYEHNTFT